ncbi:hypothetical protein ACVW0V_009152 [Bradyrhizobium elkanii]
MDEFEKHRQFSASANRNRLSVGFGLLAIPSVMTFFKVFRLLFAQI